MVEQPDMFGPRTFMEDVSRATLQAKRLEAEHLEAFKAWWAKYPRKIAKPKAEKVYLSVLRSRKATIDELNQGLERYIDHVTAERAGGFNLAYCHATTWLNQGRWTDEYSGGKPREDAFAALRERQDG